MKWKEESGSEEEERRRLISERPRGR